MAGINQKKYVEWLEYIARNTKLISNGPNNDHFDVIITKKPDSLGRVNIEGFLSNLRTTLKSPMLIAICYTSQLADNESDSIVKDFSGAFVLLKKATSTNMPDKLEAIDEMEQLAEIILGYMRQDAENKIEEADMEDIKLINFNEVTIDPVEIKSMLCGVYVELPFKTWMNRDITYNENHFHIPL